MKLPGLLAAAAGGTAAYLFAMQRSRGHGSSAKVSVAAVLAGAFAGVAVVLARWRRDEIATFAAYGKYPRQYVAARGTPDTIDGDVHKDVWKRVKWSEPFVEIRGRDAPPGTGPTKTQATRVKMLWDDEYLYIAAVMDFPQGDEFVAKFTERNSPIFHTDSDFEVFLDPAGCCHGYKELELNPINTVWNLMLTKPYMDGGGEKSGRVAKPGEANHWEVRSQKTATRMLRGALQDRSQPSQWCCEIALAHSDSLPHAPVQGSAPAVGKHWRINFSRVENKGNTNWVWSPQVVWAPEKHGFEGQVNMHLPDAWGYVLFADERGKLATGEDAVSWRDPAWPARFGAAAIYYAARSFKSTHKRYPKSVKELQQAGLVGVEASILQGMEATIATDMEADGYVAQVRSKGWQATIRQDRLMEESGL